MDKTLCTVLENWLKEQDIPIMRIQLLPSCEETLWGIILTEHLYILLTDAKINLIHLVPFDDECCKVVSLATLSPADPRCFSRLNRVLKRVLV